MLIGTVILGGLTVRTELLVGRRHYRRIGSGGRLGLKQGNHIFGSGRGGSLFLYAAFLRRLTALRKNPFGFGLSFRNNAFRLGFPFRGNAFRFGCLTFRLFRETFRFSGAAFAFSGSSLFFFGSACSLGSFFFFQFLAACSLSGSLGSGFFFLRLSASSFGSGFFFFGFLTGSAAFFFGSFTTLFQKTKLFFLRLLLFFSLALLGEFLGSAHILGLPGFHGGSAFCLSSLFAFFGLALFLSLAFFLGFPESLEFLFFLKTLCLGSFAEFLLLGLLYLIRIRNGIVAFLLTGLVYTIFGEELGTFFLILLAQENLEGILTLRELISTGNALCLGKFNKALRSFFLLKREHRDFDIPRILLQRNVTLRANCYRKAVRLLTVRTKSHT